MLTCTCIDLGWRGRVTSSIYAIGVHGVMGGKGWRSFSERSKRRTVHFRALRPIFAARGKLSALLTRAIVVHRDVSST